MTKLFRIIIGSFLALTSLVFVDSAQATPISCGGGGSYTVVSGVFTVDWSHQCTGSLVLDSSVTTLAYATYLQGVTSLTIPATTVTIQDSFIGRSLITEYIVDSNNPNYKSVDGVLYSKDGTRLISYPQSKAGLSFTLPNHVTEIISGSFHALNELQTVNITESPTITGQPFDSCCNGNTGNTLRAINVSPNNPGFASIDGVLFNKAVTELLTYPTGKQGASYIVPSTVLRLKHAFPQNLNLHSITLPAGLLEMETYEFYGAENLETIQIPASVTSLGSFPFYRAGNLRSITVAAGNLTYKSIDGVLFSKDGLTLFEYPDGRTEDSFQIPNGTTTIATQWVAANPFIRTLTIPNSVQTINYGYFVGITRVNFSGNSQLSSINQSVTFNYVNADLTVNYCGSPNSVITAFFAGKTSITCAAPAVATPEEIAKAQEIKRQQDLFQARAELIRAISSGESLTIQKFVRADLAGINDTNLLRASNRLFSANQKSKITFETIISIVNEFRIVGEIAAKSNKIYAQDLVSIQLISKDERHKVLILSALNAVPTIKLETYENILNEIKKIQEKFDVRDKKLKALRNRV
jgi:hypothetical protein